MSRTEATQPMSDHAVWALGAAPLTARIAYDDLGLPQQALWRLDMSFGLSAGQGSQGIRIAGWAAGGFMADRGRYLSNS
jgi:hypothetical protein